MRRWKRGYGVVAWVCLAVLASGCSMRHPTFLSETELARAEADSLGLDEFLDLPIEQQAERTERAEAALNPLIASEAMHRALARQRENPLTYVPYLNYNTIPALGDVIEHLDAALGLDPTRADLWYDRGYLLDIVGDQRRARVSLQEAWAVCARIPERLENPTRLRRDIAVLSAWIERDDGWWDRGLAWLDRARRDIGPDDSEAVLVRGLLLAGRGDLELAMHLSYGLPPLMLPVVGYSPGTGFMGLKKEPTDLLKRWLQAEVWLRRGEVDLAWHVLGEIPYFRKVVPMPERFWQDLGLYAELSDDSRANYYYALAYIRRPYRQNTIPIPLSCDPVIRGLPDRAVTFYRLESGAYHGGSLFAHAASAAMMALNRPTTRDAEQRYLRAHDALDVCIRRGIHPGEALALRGQLRFSRGYYVLAEMDLAAARIRFAQQGEVEPWTSYLLGLVAMGRERPDEAIALLEEAVGRDRTLAGAWNALGVAWLQVGQRHQAQLAFDRALEQDDASVQTWFNRGLLRCQTGDLDGGLHDFKQAAELDPGDERLARVIQLATVARRDGKAFLPGTDALGAWNPAPMEVHAHEDGAFSPQKLPADQLWWRRLEAVLTESLEESGANARAEGFDAYQLALLEREYNAHPTPERRKLLAYGFAWLELPAQAQAVLAPHWGRDLDQDEMLLLLWLDQHLGESRRLAELSRELSAGFEQEVAGFEWALLALGQLGERWGFGGIKNHGARYDVRRSGTSYGGRWNEWLEVQTYRIFTRTGSQNGEYLVHPRGRTYNMGSRVSGTIGGAGK